MWIVFQWHRRDSCGKFSFLFYCANKGILVAFPVSATCCLTNLYWRFWGAKVSSNSFSPHYDVKYYNVQHVTIFRFYRSACSILCWELPNIARFHQAWWSRVLAMLLGSEISMYRVAAVNCGSICLCSSINLDDVNLLTFSSWPKFLYDNVISAYFSFCWAHWLIKGFMGQDLINALEIKIPNI